MALWKRTPLYFVRQIFANPCISSELPSPLWIQKQSNYCHSPYCPPCLQERVAKPRFDAALVRSARRLYCNFCIGVQHNIPIFPVICFDTSAVAAIQRGCYVNTPCMLYSREWNMNWRIRIRITLFIHVTLMSREARYKNVRVYD